MGIPSPAEELAFLVKDNLHAKHLVLSVEEVFVEFLECPLSEEETLALEPMVSYQRMLLHRLADLFGLAHESVGEGDSRHLIVEKCEDSLIPAVLVSDILEIGIGETQRPFLSRQLLKRSIPPADCFQTPPASTNSIVSLEERRAAYFAARQRIFSGTWKYSEETSKEAGSVRPRSDPVVARRMIAHALGKPKELIFNSPSTGSIPAQDLDLQSSPVGIGGKSWEDSPGDGKTSVCIESKESIQEASAKAAKRMFANALGLPHTGTSPRVLPQQVCSNLGTCTVQSKAGENTNLDTKAPRSRNLIDIPADSSEGACPGHPLSFDKMAVGLPVRTRRHARPGGAACRIFAQALGLPDPVCSTDSIEGLICWRGSKVTCNLHSDESAGTATLQDGFPDCATLQDDFPD